MTGDRVAEIREFLADQPHTNRVLGAAKDLLAELELLRDELEATQAHGAKAVHDRDDAWRERDEAEAELESANRRLAAVEALADEWFRELENPDHLVNLEAVLDALRAALATGEGEDNDSV